jgi:hypothetical protein
MDPYLEHPTLWEGFHARLINAIAEHLQPKLDPRYVTSIEERVFIEGPQRRIPDVWIAQPQEQRGEPQSTKSAAQGKEGASTAVVVEVEDLELREGRVEILDSYDGLKLICAIEVLSPTNKRAGPGQSSYLEKQREFLSRDCHLVEIDLLQFDRRVLSIPDWRLAEMELFDYVTCVSRWPKRNRFELYPTQLRDALPVVNIPLVQSDPDVALELSAAFWHAYEAGRNRRRVLYAEPCEPSLSSEDQAWASGLVAAAKSEG